MRAAKSLSIQKVYTTCTQKNLHFSRKLTKIKQNTVCLRFFFLWNPLQLAAIGCQGRPGRPAGGNNMIVCKFGGTSLADAARIRRAGAILRRDGARRFVIVSAPGRRFEGDDKVTDLLLQAGTGNGEALAAVLARFREMAAALGVDMEGELRRAREENSHAGIGLRRQSGRIPVRATRCEIPALGICGRSGGNLPARKRCSGFGRNLPAPAVRPQAPQKRRYTGFLRGNAARRNTHVSARRLGHHRRAGRRRDGRAAIRKLDGCGRTDVCRSAAGSKYGMRAGSQLSPDAPFERHGRAGFTSRQPFAGYARRHSYSFEEQFSPRTAGYAHRRRRACENPLPDRPGAGKRRGAAGGAFA